MIGEWIKVATNRTAHELVKKPCSHTTPNSTRTLGDDPGEVNDNKSGGFKRTSSQLTRALGAALADRGFFMLLV